MIRDADLQRYFDGEATPAERDRIDTALKNDLDAQQRLLALGQMRELLRENVEMTARTANVDVWPAVRAAIAKPPSLAERIAQWWQRGWLLPAVTAATASVALIFYVSHLDHTSELTAATTPDLAPAPAPAPAPGPGLSPGLSPALSPRPPSPLAAEASMPALLPTVEIEEIESTAGAPIIVMAQAFGDVAQIPVIWLGGAP